MANVKGEGKIKDSNNFNLEKELSSLVEEKVVPQKIADKLREKLVEKNVKLDRYQLRILANKIMEAVKNYKKSDKINDKDGFFSNDEIKDLKESIQTLEQRLNQIQGKPTGIVTTDDIDVPSAWDMDPLNNIPNDPESIIIVMKWLQYLIDKCGRMNLNEILDYYVDIGWINDEVKISLLDYSSGISEEKYNNGKNQQNANDLSSNDHIQSLMFIQKLKGYKFDKHFIDRIEGEMSRISKKIENYKHK